MSFGKRPRQPVSYIELSDDDVQEIIESDYEKSSSEYESSSSEDESSSSEDEKEIIESDYESSSSEDEDLVPKNEAFCKRKKCKVTASLAYYHTSKRIYCAKHRMPNMWNPGLGMCMFYPKCKNVATHQKPGKLREYCAIHALGLVGYNHTERSLCQYKKCGHYALHPANGDRIYCTTHRYSEGGSKFKRRRIT